MITVQLARAVAPGVIPTTPYVYETWIAMAPPRTGEYVKLSSTMFPYLFRVSDVVWMREDIVRVFLEEAK